MMMITTLFCIKNCVSGTSSEEFDTFEEHLGLRHKLSSEDSVRYVSHRGKFSSVIPAIMLLLEFCRKM